MPLELILGRAKTGKSTAVLEAFLKQENAILVVPEQYSFSMEKKITERLGVFGLDGRQVMSFKRLAAKAAGKFLPFGQKPLSKDARCMAIYAIMKELAGELRVLENAQEKPGFTKTMVEMISELKRYQVTQEQLLALSEKLESPLLSMKLSDIAKIYGRFNDFLGKDFFDGDDALTLFEKIIAETGYLNDTWVFFDQFSSFTPQECACIAQMLSGAKGVTVSLCLNPKSQGPEFLATRRTYERLCKMAGGAQNVKVKSLSKSHGLCPALKHLEQNYFAYPFVPFAQKTDDVVLYQGQDPREELEFVASQICTLTRDFGYYYRDIALLFADAQSYNDLAADVFQKYEIPYFSDRLSAVSDHPVVQFVLSAVDMASSGFTYEAVFGYLKSGYANLNADRGGPAGKLCFGNRPSALGLGEGRKMELLHGRVFKQAGRSGPAGTFRADGRGAPPVFKAGAGAERKNKRAHAPCPKGALAL